ncbi:MAG: alpha/beta family hydrolase [Candidatus Melainabacteria bacterium]|nr:alpha/beta family hydrolase [Candidatus Melainabacteria bacterium]
MTERKVKFDGLDGVVSGAAKRGCVIITHGAGRGMDAPLLENTSSGLVELGFMVLRFNFGYMGKRPAPSMGGKNEKPELVSAIEFMKEHGNPILIGKSFGARVSTYVAAERSDIRALVYYGLPIQGMSKNSKPRDWSHLANLSAPMLFITGDKDKLCPMDELEKIQKNITADFKSEVVAGDHSFKPKSEGKAKELCLSWIDELIKV